jgi:hypothetical protein
MTQRSGPGQNEPLRGADQVRDVPGRPVRVPGEHDLAWRDAVDDDEHHSGRSDGSGDGDGQVCHPAATADVRDDLFHVADVRPRLRMAAVRARIERPEGVPFGPRVGVEENGLVGQGSDVDRGRCGQLVPGGEGDADRYQAGSSRRRDGSRFPGPAPPADQISGGHRGEAHARAPLGAGFFALASFPAVILALVTTQHFGASGVHLPPAADARYQLTVPRRRLPMIIPNEGVAPRVPPIISFSQARLAPCR